MTLFAAGRRHVFEQHPLHEVADASAAASGNVIVAPMPGRIVVVNAAVGDAVNAGDVLMVMEAMKMEHTIAAPADGVVQELLYAPGDQVTEGAELLKLVVADKA